MLPPRTSARGAVSLLLLTTLSVCALFEARGRVPFTSDQAVVAIMAEDILEHGAHPVFYYGAEYAGTLEPHYVAAAFAVLGASPLVFRCAMAALVALAVLGAWAAGRMAFGARAGLGAGLYLAVGPAFFLYKGLTSDGAYASLLVLSGTALVLMQAVEARFRASADARAPLAGLGLTLGLAFWVHTPSVFLVAVLLAAMIAGRTRCWLKGSSLGLLLAGFFLGSAPWWSRNLETGFKSLTTPEMATAKTDRFLAQAGALFTDGWSILLGARPAWSPEPAFPGSAPAALVLLLVLLAWGLRSVARGGNPEARFGAALCVTALVSLSALSLLASRTDFAEPRYLFAGYAALAPLVGALVESAWPHRLLRALLIAVLLALNLGSQMKAPALRHADPGRATAAEYDLGPVTARLRARGVAAVYTSYWVAYRLSFVSGEEIVASPLGRGPHGNVRIPRLKEAVDRAPDPGFLLSGEDREDMRAYLSTRGLAARRESLDGFALWRGLPEASVAVMRRCNCIPTTIGPGEAAVEKAEGPDRLPAGTHARFRAQVRNDSPRPFSNNVHLSYHWIRPDGSVALWDGARAATSAWPIGVTLSEIVVEANVPPGEYRLAFDLVDESVTWFEDLGGRTLRLPVRVELPRR